MAAVLAACSRESVQFTGETGLGDVSVGMPQDSLENVKWQARYAAMRRSYITDLFRSYGVGYGYNALGEYASYNDVRDRIIDLDELKESYPSMIYDIQTPTAFQHVIEGKNSEKYLDNLKMLAGINANLGFFQGQAKVDYTESDMRLDYLSYCSVLDGITMVQRHLEPYDLVEATRRNPDILSPGFRHYVELAKKENDRGNLEQAILILDEMFKTYGTHLIYHAELGGTISFQCTIDRRSLDSRVTLKSSAQYELSLISGSKTETTRDSAFSVTKENRKSKMIIKGGDASLATKVLYIDTDLPEQRNQLVNEWYQSVCFDPTDQYKSNVELVGLKLFPVSEFIHDEGLKMLYNQIMGIAVDIENEAFPRVYETRNVRLNANVLDFDFKYSDGSYGKAKSLVSVVSGGEVIGEVDYEIINGREYSVFYPTIDGSVHHEGIGRCLQTDSLCTVTWTYTVLPGNTRVYVTPIAPESSVPYLYYTAGSLDVVPEDSVEYSLSYSENPLDLRMWNDRCNSGFKYGPYWLIRGCYATRKDAGYGNYISMIEDVPHGYQKVDLKELPTILKTIGTISGVSDMPAFLNQFWIMPPVGISGIPDVYDFRNIKTNSGTLPEESDNEWGFILCKRSQGFRYP